MDKNWLKRGELCYTRFAIDSESLGELDAERSVAVT